MRACHRLWCVFLVISNFKFLNASSDIFRTLELKLKTETWSSLLLFEPVILWFLKFNNFRCGIKASWYIWWWDNFIIFLGKKTATWIILLRTVFYLKSAKENLHRKWLRNPCKYRNEEQIPSIYNSKMKHLLPEKKVSCYKSDDREEKAGQQKPTRREKQSHASVKKLINNRTFIHQIEMGIKCENILGSHQFNPPDFFPSLFFSSFLWFKQWWKNGSWAYSFQRGIFAAEMDSPPLRIWFGRKNPWECEEISPN